VLTMRPTQIKVFELEVATFGSGLTWVAADIGIISCNEFWTGELGSNFSFYW
jgi:hypothetical protein